MRPATLYHRDSSCITVAGCTPRACRVRQVTEMAEKNRPRTGQTTFKTAAFNRSATSPRYRIAHLERISGRVYPANPALIQHPTRKTKAPLGAQLGSGAEVRADVAGHLLRLPEEATRRTIRLGSAAAGRARAMVPQRVRGYAKKPFSPPSIIWAPIVASSSPPMRISTAMVVGLARPRAHLPAS